MKHLYLFLAFFSLWALSVPSAAASGSLLPMDSLLPNQFLKTPQKPPRFSSAICVFAGSDLESTSAQHVERFQFKHYFNLGLGYRMNLNKKWQLGAELWVSSYATPRISVYDYRVNFTDNDKSVYRDTTNLLRMQGVVLAFSAGRQLPAGFSLHAGAQLGYFPLAITEYGSSLQFDSQNYIRYRSGWSRDFTEAPTWVRHFQPALRFAAEKRFWNVVILGVSMQQTLTDITKHGNTRNMPMNWQGYVGLQMNMD